MDSAGVPSVNAHSHLTVLVSDTSPMSCELLAKALRESDEGFRVVACATKAAEVVEAIRAKQPDVALISAQLEDVPTAGLGVLREIPAISANTRAIFLVEGAGDLVVEAFRLAAKGIFYRCDPFALLCKAIHRVGMGQIWLSHNDLEFVLERLTSASQMRLVNVKGGTLLTKREEQVVFHVAEGLSNRDIAQQMHLSQHTVKNYMFRIFDKLGVSSRAELILYALNNQQQAGIGAKHAA